MTCFLRHLLRSLIVIVLAGGSAALSAQAAEETAVRQAVEHYLMGHATGDGAHHRMVFHPISSLYWVNADTLTTMTSAAFIAGSSGRPAADESERRRWIEAVDVTGTAAMAKVVLDYPAARFTDYFALLKVEGEWKIVNKIFNWEVKERR